MHLQSYWLLFRWNMRCPPMLNPILFCLNDQLPHTPVVCTLVIVLLSLWFGYWYFHHQVFWGWSGSVLPGDKAGHPAPKQGRHLPSGCPFQHSLPHTRWCNLSLWRRYSLSRQLILLGSSGDPGGQVPLHVPLLGEPSSCAVSRGLWQQMWNYIHLGLQCASQLQKIIYIFIYITVLWKNSSSLLLCKTDH